MEDFHPTLPALENVKIFEKRLWVVLVFYAPFAIISGLFLGYLGFHNRQYIPESMFKIITIIPALVLYLLARILFGFISFETNANGLIMRRIIGKKYLKWEEIITARNKYSKISSSTCLCIESRNNIYKLNISYGIDAALLTASVRQHLMPFGRANEIILDDIAKSLWTPIPEIIPTNISFGKAPSNTGKIFAWIFFVGFCLLALFGSYSLFTHSWFSKIMGLWLLTAFTVMLKICWSDTMLKAKSVKINANGLEAQCYAGAININWDDVNNTYWFKDSLYIYTDKPKKLILINLIAGNKESESLILAIIRNLRYTKTPQALIMPYMVIIKPEILKHQSGSSSIQMAYINSLDEPAKSKVKKLWTIQLTFLLCWIPIGTLLGFVPILENSIKHIWNGNAADVRFFFAPTTGFFAIPIMILLLPIFEIISSKICRRLATPYEKEWDHARFISLPSKDAKKYLKIIFVIIGITFIVFVTLSFNCFFKVSDDNIVIGRFGNTNKEVYNWNDVKSITNSTSYTYRQGHTSEDKTYTITFSDRTQWMCSDNTSQLSCMKDMPQAMSFISKKSGIPITASIDN